MKPAKPLVYVVDDDPEFLAIVTRMLEALGLNAETFETPEPFLKRLKAQRPALALIDLNIGHPRAGFAIVGAVRAAIGSELPLLISSATSDLASIAHAVELGANDFLTKPLDSDLLAAKLLNYVRSGEIVAESFRFLAVPDGGVRVAVELEATIVGIDELGIKLRSRHLFNKGSTLTVAVARGKISGELRVTVVNTWADAPRAEHFGAYAEIEAGDAAGSALLRSLLHDIV